MAKMRRGCLLWLWLITSLVIGLTACGGTQAIPIRELERTASANAGRVVTVEGCYHNGPETTLL